MGLWIINQDKTHLILANDMKINDKIILVNNLEFGKYKTNERAKEILNEMIKEVNEYLGNYAEMVYELPDE